MIGKLLTTLKIVFLSMTEFHLSSYLLYPDEAKYTECFFISQLCVISKQAKLLVVSGTGLVTPIAMKASTSCGLKLLIS